MIFNLRSISVLGPRSSSSTVGSTTLYQSYRITNAEASSSHTNPAVRSCTGTGGWPHLVQLVAETTIDLLNDEKETRLNPALLERAEEQAVVRGHNVLYQLLHGESTLPGEWAYLEGFRASAIQPPPTDPAVFKSLRRRLLVEEDADDAWRLRLPLMARWLRVRG